MSFLTTIFFRQSIVKYYFTPSEFFTQTPAGGLSEESKWQQVFRIILSILINLNNALVWRELILPLISISSKLFSRPLATVPSAPTTISIPFTLMFHSVFLVLGHGPSICLSCFLLFSLWSVRMAKSTRWQVLFFC